MTMAAEILTEPLFHLTVMAEEVTSALAPRGGGVYLDVTAGWGGHSEALLLAHPDARVIAVDRDPAAVQASAARLLPFGSRASVWHARFAELPALLAELEVAAVDGLVADLGVSSPQLDDPERGLSFRYDAPLDMRMDPTTGMTALEVVEQSSREELADLLYQLGGERRSRRVARCIKQAQESGQLATTLELRRAVVRAVGPRRVGGVDPATRTFQALRIAVNDELGQLEALLGHLPRVLRPGAVAALISFHSLEDRLVKLAFREREVWERLTPKPRTPRERELADNPRSRSAKLRAARLLDADGGSP